MPNLHPPLHMQIAMPLADGRCYQRLAMSPTGVIAASYEGTVHFISRCASVLGFAIYLPVRE